MSSRSRNDKKSYSNSNRKCSTNSRRDYLRDDDDHSHNRKRSHSNRSNDQSNSQISLNIDSKVYVGNVPTDRLTDRELLDFFRPFGKISDIRVYKGYIFVQYEKIDDAKKLIEQGQNCLILKGNKLDILPSMDANSNDRKSSSIERSFKDHPNSPTHSSRSIRRPSDNYEPPTKRHTDQNQQHRSTHNQNNYRDSNGMEMDDNIADQLFCSKRSSSDRDRDRLNRSPNSDNQLGYKLLSGPDNPRKLVDCRIILVNIRQRVYGEEIASRLCREGLITSVVLLREDYTLNQAIENAANDHCLYGIILMPLHEQRRTASVHILYGQREEHRNLKLDDGINLILKSYNLYKQNLLNEELKKSNLENVQSITKNYPREEYLSEQELRSSPIKLNDKLPLSILLCLLADGRQLTLEEIDRVLVYLLEKKAKMLTLPKGTLPPLPAQYAFNQTNEGKSSKNLNDLLSSSESELSSTIVEQIRQIVSSNILKSTSLNSTNEQISERIRINPNDQNSNDYQQKTSNSIPLLPPSFHYPSSLSTNNNNNSSSAYLTSNYSSSQYLYPSTTPSTTNSNTNIYQNLTNSAAADAAAAIFQAYSQFNSSPTPMNNQHIQK